MIFICSRMIDEIIADWQAQHEFCGNQKYKVRCSKMAGALFYRGPFNRHEMDIILPALPQIT